MRKKLTTMQKRAALQLAYSDRKWIEKVDKMTPLQIYAIFDNLVKEGIINFNENGDIYFRSKEEIKELKKKRQEAKCGHQITLDEFFGDLIESRKENNDNGKNE